MPKKEDTPIVIDFKNPTNYGAASGGGCCESVDVGNSACHRDGASRQSQMFCLHGHNKVEMRDHCHRQRSEGVDVKARKKLIIASVLCFVFMILEVIGGVLSNSLAIATDAAHLLTDLASFMISLFAIWLAGRPSTKRMSFGWYRAEVIGAVTSVVMIWFITAILVFLAVQRIINRDFEVDAKIMLITSGLAILVNLIMGIQLQHGHTHGMSSTPHKHGHDEHRNLFTGVQLSRKSKCEELGICGRDRTAISVGVATQTNSINGKARESITQADQIESAPCESDESVAPSAVCPASPTERIEDGVSDLAEVDAELPAAGLSTFSYQNTTNIVNARTEIAAVVAETSAGGHHHGGEARREAVNLNVRAAFIHVIGDVIQSTGVFVAALIIFFRPDWAIVDPICTFIFSVIVLFTTFAIMKDALLVLMEGTPTFMEYGDVLQTFLHIEGVERVHNLRIWALSISKVALSVHLAIAPGADAKRILEEANTAVHRRYNFFETTIQIEEVTQTMDNCLQCLVPEK